MQLPPPPDTASWLVSLLSELVDAKWAVTTLVALYAAILSTFQTFIKDWWQRRARLKVTVYEAIMAGNGESEEMLATGVVNEGYHSRRINGSLSFQLRADQPHRLKRFAYWLTRRPLGFKSYLVVNPMFVPAKPERLEPTDNYAVYLKQSTVWQAA